MKKNTSKLTFSQLVYKQSSITGIHTYEMCQVFHAHTLLRFTVVCKCEIVLIYFVPWGHHICLVILELCKVVSSFQLFIVLVVKWIGQKMSPWKVVKFMLSDWLVIEMRHFFLYWGWFYHWVCALFWNYGTDPRWSSGIYHTDLAIAICMLLTWCFSTGGLWFTWRFESESFFAMLHNFLPRSVHQPFKSGCYWTMLYTDVMMLTLCLFLWGIRCDVTDTSIIDICALCRKIHMQ